MIVIFSVGFFKLCFCLHVRWFYAINCTYNVFQKWTGFKPIPCHLTLNEVGFCFVSCVDCRQINGRELRQFFWHCVFFFFLLPCLVEIAPFMLWFLPLHFHSLNRKEMTPVITSALLQESQSAALPVSVLGKTEASFDWRHFLITEEWFTVRGCGWLEFRSPVHKVSWVNFTPSPSISLNNEILMPTVFLMMLVDGSSFYGILKNVKRDTCCCSWISPVCATFNTTFFMSHKNVILSWPMKLNILSRKQIGLSFFSYIGSLF